MEYYAKLSVFQKVFKNMQKHSFFLCLHGDKTVGFTEYLVKE